MDGKKVINYIGQLRIYSLIDLILLLFVAFSGDFNLILGGILLHLSFIIYLEYSHNHKYRATWHPFIWIILGIAGIYFYHNISVIGYILASYIYTKKSEWKIGYFSFIFRGLQVLFLIGGVVDYTSNIGLMAFILLSFRNLFGDLRDVEKDRMEKVKTFPLLIGMRKSIPYIHLIGVIATTLIWWSFSTLNWLIIIGIIAIEILTYNLTKR